MNRAKGCVPLRNGWVGLAAIAILIVSATVACTSGSDGSSSNSKPGVDTPSVEKAPPQLVRSIEASLADGGPACDWLDHSQCLFPFPSSRFERDDPTSGTGRRIAIPGRAMPTNAKGVQASPEPYNRGDGWGVGTPIMTSIAGVDPEASRFAPESNLADSLRPDSGTVLVDLTAGKRLAHWAELDARPEVPAADRTTVLIRPAAMLPEGHRIGVAIRAPVGRNGRPIAVDPAFRVYRDNLRTELDPVEQRRKAMERLFTGLGKAGVERSDLYLAWDFQVMSTEDLTGDLLTMRDRAFAELGDKAPAYRITEVRTDADDGTPLPDGVAKWVRGSYDVPSFLSGDGSPGQTLVRDDAGDPVVSGTYSASFTCAVTTRQMDGTKQSRPVVYGHGLLGDYHEAERGDLGAASADLMLCGTYWVGMSDPDIGYAVETLQSIDGFPSLTDRLRQGIVNQLFLGRLLGRADGIASSTELRGPGGATTLDSSEVFFEGHSQGGIEGFAATAVSNEWSKAIIGVPGVNYSLLIPRSNNWQTYGPVIATGYPGAVEGLVILGLLQQQWDRAEGSGYVRYVTGGLPGTHDHQVIEEVALGDHQVANVSSEVAARTAGIPVRKPTVGKGRLPWKTPPFGLETVGPGEKATSLMVYWDAGTMSPPLGSQSPDSTATWKQRCLADVAAADIAFCSDPHEFPRRTPEAQQQRNEFFATGTIRDVCGSDPCRTRPRG